MRAVSPLMIVVSSPSVVAGGWVDGQGVGIGGRTDLKSTRGLVIDSSSRLALERNSSSQLMK